MSIITLNASVKTRDFGKSVNEAVWMLSVFKGDLIDVVTIDGVSDDYKCEIHLHNWFTNRTYALNNVFIGKIESLFDEECGYHDFYVRSETLADRLIEKMKAKGQIDLTYWIDITNDPAYA